MRQPIAKITSRTVVLPMANIDTDQIIPARFLTTTTSEGLGEHAFADWRLETDFPLNDPRAEGCAVLVAGHNFGCGSSREHAPWALLDLGIKAVLSTGIADIFRSNALKNGLLPVVIDPQTHAWLLANPWTEVVIDLEDCTLCFGAGSTTRFSMDGFARRCLLEGVDELGYLLAKVDVIEAFEAGR